MGVMCEGKGGGQWQSGRNGNGSGSEGRTSAVLPSAIFCVNSKLASLIGVLALNSVAQSPSATKAKRSCRHDNRGRGAAKGG